LSPLLISPLRKLGRGITDITGWSVFSGPLGWLFSALLLLAMAMIIFALALGRGRTSRASSTGRGERERTDLRR
jgi:hypothetical protein